MKALRLKLAQAMIKLENNEGLAQRLESGKNKNDNVKIVYSFSSSLDDLDTVTTLEDIDFDMLGETLREVVDDLQESPKLKELANKIKQLEEEQTKKETNN